MRVCGVNHYTIADNSVERWDVRSRVMSLLRLSSHSAVIGPNIFVHILSRSWSSAVFETAISHYMIISFMLAAVVTSLDLIVLLLDFKPGEISIGHRHMLALSFLPKGFEGAWIRANYTQWMTERHRLVLRPHPKKRGRVTILLPSSTVLPYRSPIGNTQLKNGDKYDALR